MKKNQLPKLLAVFALVFSSLFANAENKISIEPFAIGPGQTQEVSVYLENDADMLNMQFDLVLPYGLSLVMDDNDWYVQPTDRIDLDSYIWRTSTPNNTVRTYRIACLNRNFQSRIGGESGTPVATFTVKANDNAFNSSSKLEMTVNKIYYTNASAPSKDITQEEFNVTINQNIVVVLAASPAEINVDSYSNIPVTLSLENEQGCYGFQFDMTLPEGLTYAEGSYEKCTRMSKSTEIYEQVNGNTVRFLFTNWGSPCFKGNEGDFMVINLKADSELANKSEITFSNIVLSDAKAKPWYGNTNADGKINKSFSIPVTNNVPGSISEKYDSDVEAINQLAQAFQEFVNDVNENFPGYAKLKAEEIGALSATIAALNEKVTNAIENAYETGVYDGLTGAEISAANKALIDLVIGEEETMKAITDAYDEDVAKVNELATAMQQFVDEASENFPGYLVLKKEEVGAINAQIQALNDKVTAAIESANNTGVYDGLASGEVNAVTEALMALVNGEEETIKAITDAYDEDVAKVNELANAMQQFVNETSENFPGYLTLKADEIAAINASIEALNNKVAKAMETAFETGVYDGLASGEVNAVTEALMALIAGEEETIKAITDAYDEDVAKIDELAKAYQEIINEINEDFPGYAESKSAEIAAIYASIEALNDKVAKAMESAFETGVYDGLASGEVNNVTEALMALNSGMTEAYNDIVNAADADKEKIDAVEKEVKEILENGSESDLADEVVAMIESLKNQIAAAEEKAMNESGEYVSPLTQETMATLDELVSQLQAASGIDSITIQESKARYFDMNGREVSHPAPGKAYIKVVGNKATKVTINMPK